MKSYTLRIDIRIEANSDDEAKKYSALLLREMPRLENQSVLKTSLYSVVDKKIIQEEV